MHHFLICFLSSLKYILLALIIFRSNNDILFYFFSPNFLVAYDPRRHQGMTLRRWRSRHPRASSPLDRRRRRMPSFTIPSEDLISPRHISQGSHARGVIFPVFSFIMNLFSPHVFKRAFASLLPSLLGR